MSFDEYLRAIPRDYRDYDVQRSIVRNAFLDRLVDTVLDGGYIPPIVLVASDGEESADHSAIFFNHIKILDGLQRTFRLKAIAETIDFCLRFETREALVSSIALGSFQFSRRFSEEMRKIDSSTPILRTVIARLATAGEEALRAALSSNQQWFEIWTNVSSAQEVSMMLKLNAGHKAVSPRHQLELLFLNMLIEMQDAGAVGLVVVREKQRSAVTFAKTRRAGEFHFSHLISSLLSLDRGKPVAPTAELIQEVQTSQLNEEEPLGSVAGEPMREYLKFLVKLDGMLQAAHGESGRIWMGRDVSLTALSAAIGSVAHENKESVAVVSTRLLTLLEKEPQALSLDAFEEARNRVDLRSVNIGNVNRIAIFRAVRRLLVDGDERIFDWTKLFLPESS